MSETALLEAEQLDQEERMHAVEHAAARAVSLAVEDDREHHENSESAATFDAIVADLELDSDIEKDTAGKAVLELVADAWRQTDAMPREEAAKTREWLVDVSLRAVGDKSRYVREHQLEEYLPDDQEAAAIGELFQTYGESEASRAFAEGAPGIMADFQFSQKFGHQEQPDLQFCVVPEGKRAQLMALTHGATGMLAKLPGTNKVLLFQKAVIKKLLWKKVQSLVVLSLMN